MSDSESRTIVTPEAILSFPRLFKPEAFSPKDPPKYKATLIFEDGTDLTALYELVMNVGSDEFGGREKFTAMLKAQEVKLPFKKDWEKRGYPENSIYIRTTASEENRPGLVSIYESEPGSGIPAELNDPSEWYPGARVKAALYAHPYDKAGNRGITFLLNHLQKVGDGPRLAGRAPAAAVFNAEARPTASLEDLDNAPEAGAEQASGGGDTPLADLM